MSLWDYAYNPYGIPAVRNKLVNYLNKVGKGIGVPGLGTKGAPYASRFGQMKVNAIRSFFKRSKSKKRDRGGKHKGSKRVQKMVVGSSIRRYGRGRPALDSKAARYGVVFRNEARHEVSDKEIVHLAHGPATATLMLCLAASLWRKLYEKTGYRLNDWNSKPERPSDNIRFKIAIDYYVQNDGIHLTNTTGSASSLATALALNDTHNNYAQKIRGLLVDSCSNPPIFRLIRIYIQSATATGSEDLHAEISCLDLKFSFVQDSVLNMQNTSLDSSASASTDTVTSNPLTGRQWEVSGNVIRTRAFHKLAAGLQATGYMVEPEYGVLHGAGSIDGTLLKVAGPREIDNVIRTRRENVLPGQIRVSKLLLKRTVYVNQFLRAAFEWMQSSAHATVDTTKKPFYMLKSRYYSFEKLLQHQTSAATAECKLAFEINNKFSAFVHSEKKNVAGPMEYVEPLQAPAAAF